MLYNEINLAVADIADKKNTRFDSVLFTANETVATDTYRIIEVSCPEIPADDFPSLDGMIKDISEPIYLKAEGLKKIKVPKSKTLPMLEHVILADEKEDSVSIISTDLETINRTTVCKNKGEKFPEYQQLFEQGKDDDIEITVNAEYLIGLLKILSKVEPLGYVKIKVGRGFVPILLSAKNKNQKARALLMPVKL